MVERAMTERQKREAAAYQFELQANRLYLEVVARLTNYRYQVRDETSGQQLTAMILAESFDFYQYRLNRGKSRVDLVIVQRHNAVLPLRVISLEDGKEYQPGAAPSLQREGAKVRNSEESRLLVSKLIMGLDSAHEELAAMPDRTRQWYQQRCNAFLRPRVGRPWAS